MEQKKVISCVKSQTKTGKTIYKTQFEGDQNTYTGFGDENAVQVGQIASVETWSKQNGQYVNYNYKVVSTGAPSQGYQAPQQTYSQPQQNYQTPSQPSQASQNTDALLSELREIKNAMVLRAAQEALKAEGKPFGLDQSNAYVERINGLIKR